MGINTGYSDTELRNELKNLTEITEKSGRGMSSLTRAIVVLTIVMIALMVVQIAIAKNIL